MSHFKSFSFSCIGKISNIKKNVNVRLYNTNFSTKCSWFKNSKLKTFK